MATAKATTSAPATGATAEKRSTVKLDTIRDIEKKMQKLWADAKVFEADAPGHPTKKSDLSAPSNCTAISLFADF